MRRGTQNPNLKSIKVFLMFCFYYFEKVFKARFYELLNRMFLGSSKNSKTFLLGISDDKAITECRRSPNGTFNKKELTS